MMDFNERVIPGVSANFLYQEALARYKFAQRYLKKLNKVLDLGCGVGYGSYYLASKRSVKINSLDNDSEAIEYASKKYGHSSINYMFSDADNLPFENNHFDLVVSFEVVEHLKNPGKYLEEIYRVIKNGGVFILSTPNRNCRKSVGPKSKYHLKEYNFEEINTLLSRQFKQVSLYGQKKSVKAENAFNEFLKSQEKRQILVNTDRLGIRRLFPRALKESLWRILGTLFGRASQESLNTIDFPITLIDKKMNKEDFEYIIAVCKKS